MYRYTTGNQFEICSGSSTMERRVQVQSYPKQTALTSELNLKNAITSLLFTLPQEVN